MIEERRVAATATSNFSADILKVIVTLREALSNQQRDEASRIQGSLEVIDSIVESLESYPVNQREEIIKLEATQEGIRRTLEAVKSVGENELKEIDSVNSPVKNEKLPEAAQLNDDIEWEDDT